MRTITFAAMLFVAAAANAQIIAGELTVIPSKIPAQLKDLDTTRSLDALLPASVQRVDAFAVLKETDGKTDCLPVVIVQSSDPKAFQEFAAGSPTWNSLKFESKGGVLVGLQSAKPQAVEEGVVQRCMAASREACADMGKVTIYPADVLAFAKTDKTGSQMLEQMYKSQPVMQEFENVKTVRFGLSSDEALLKLSIAIKGNPGSALNAFLSQTAPSVLPSALLRLDVDNSAGCGYALWNVAAVRAYWTHLEALLNKSDLPPEGKAFVGLMKVSMTDANSSGYVGYVLKESPAAYEILIGGRYTPATLKTRMDGVCNFSNALFDSLINASAAMNPDKAPVASIKMIQEGPVTVSGSQVWVTKMSTSKDMPLKTWSTRYTLKDGNLLEITAPGEDPQSIAPFIEALNAAPQKSLQAEFANSLVASARFRLNFNNTLELIKRLDSTTPELAAQLGAMQAILSPDDSLNAYGTLSNGTATISYELPLSFIHKVVQFAQAAQAAALSAREERELEAARNIPAPVEPSAAPALSPADAAAGAVTPLPTTSTDVPSLPTVPPTPDTMPQTLPPTTEIPTLDEGVLTVTLIKTTQSADTDPGSMWAIRDGTPGFYDGDDKPIWPAEQAKTWYRLTGADLRHGISDSQPRVLSIKLPPGQYTLQHLDDKGGVSNTSGVSWAMHAPWHCPPASPVINVEAGHTTSISVEKTDAQPVPTDNFFGWHMIWSSPAIQ